MSSLDWHEFLSNQHIFLSKGMGMADAYEFPSILVSKHIIVIEIQKYLLN